jgi:CheY-like chemotaxis protein
MSKVLLVEDDNNLREIYEARLQAEGYEIASAMDGEQALVVAKQFKPDLVISDVMMPKISGFEMLDILRNTEGLKNTRVIMLTALGQAEDKTRADSLGADRYLVKSQVTLEDIIRAAHDVLGGDGTAAGTTPAGDPAATPAEPTATPATDVPMATAPEPATPSDTATPAPSEPVAAAPAEPVAAPEPPESTAEAPAAPAAETPPAEPAPAPEAEAAPTTSSSDDQLLAEAANSLAGMDAAASETPAADADSTDVPMADDVAPAAPKPDNSTGFGERVIQPPADGGDGKPSLEELLAREEAKEAAGTTGATITPTATPEPAATPAPAGDDSPVTPEAPGTAITPQAPGPETPAPAPEGEAKKDDFNPHDISL